MSIHSALEPPNAQRRRDRPAAVHTHGNDAAVKVAGILKLVAEPTRLGIVKILAGGERSVAELIGEFPGVEDQLISRHLGVLRLGGAVESLTFGRSRIYELTDLGRFLVRVTDMVARV